jgi:hypothetical protein
MKIQLRVVFIAIAYLFFAHALAAEQIVVCYSVRDSVAKSAAVLFEKETGIQLRLVQRTVRQRLKACRIV